MINLAGNKECDKFILEELERAQIKSVKLDKPDNGEVPYNYIGSLADGKLTFRRAWYYWMVEGKVPKHIAEKIYAHPEGKKTVRIAGHCGCMDPSEYGLTYFDKATGQKIMTETDLDTLKRHFKEEHWSQYTIDKGQPQEQFATHYHIDDQAGLLLFSMIMSQYWSA